MYLRAQTHIWPLFLSCFSHTHRQGSRHVNIKHILVKALWGIVVDQNPGFILFPDERRRAVLEGAVQLKGQFKALVLVLMNLDPIDEHPQADVADFALCKHSFQRFGGVQDPRAVLSSPCRSCRTRGGRLSNTLRVSETTFSILRRLMPKR